MKSTLVSVIAAAALIGGAIVFTQGSGSAPADGGVQGNNVSVVDGKQIIEIRAKGNFTPNKTVAKAGVPTILRFDTQGTFDCTSVVRIPSMDITKNLPPSGSTDIDLGTPAMATLQGTCGMGMYPFEIEFQS